jgi:ADP-ribosyl-[dinitrogen reductase] hydrolase
MTDLLAERALGAYLGFAVGDALGATVEFMTPREIVAAYGVHRRIIGGGWLRLKPGQVTDDTQMSLALGRAIIGAKGWDLQAVCEQWAAWLRSGPVDVGNTCRRGITNYIRTGSMSKPFSEGDGGNGACMRNLPVMLATLNDSARMAAWSLEQAHVTHNHPLSDAALLCFGDMMRDLLTGDRTNDPANGPTDNCRAAADALVAQYPTFRYVRNGASAYIVETVQTVLHHYFSTDSFESCLVAVVNQGGDADTTGALAGMLAGATYGVDAIPRLWLNKLDPAVAAEIRDQVPRLLAL